MSGGRDGFAHTRAAGLHTSSLIHRCLAFSDAFAALVFPVKLVHCESQTLVFPSKVVHCESQILGFPGKVVHGGGGGVPNPSFSWEISAL